MPATSENCGRDFDLENLARGFCDLLHRAGGEVAPIGLAEYLGLASARRGGIKVEWPAARRVSV